MAPSSPAASPSSTQPQATNPPLSQLSGTKRKEFDLAIEKEGSRAKKPRRGGRQRVFTPKSAHDELESAAKYYKRNVDFDVPFHMAVIEGIRIAGRGEWDIIVEQLPPPIVPASEDEIAGNNDDSPAPNTDNINSNLEGDESSVADREYLAHCRDAWAVLIVNQPVVAEFVDYVAESGNVQGFLTLITSMTEESDQMLWNDNSVLKKAAFDLLVPSTFPFSMHIKPAKKKSSKDDRGMKSDLILEQFLSWDDIIPYRDDDEAGPIIAVEYRSIVDPKALQATDLPALLYDPEMVEETSRTKGFLFSPFLIRCGQHVLTSESSVGQDPVKISTTTKKVYTDNAGKMNMYKVPIGFIAYIATLARFALSTVPRWGSNDDTFSFIDFYYLIIKLFRKMLPDDQMAILNFWNLSIFGNEKGRIRRSARSAATIEGSNADLFMQDCEEMAENTAAAATGDGNATGSGSDEVGSGEGTGTIGHDATADSGST
ncbi:hypothetical protein PQX77_009321 [Marasmius sp. AFHP31]|nr:hypothetical protein PQX77_009321 [Marasmius sp. AFHP31]